MNILRLQHLENILRANATNPTGMKFDLKAWGEVPVGTVREKGHVPVDCGTVGCAVGLATLDPVFNAQGFRNIIPSSGFSTLRSDDEKLPLTPVFDKWLGIGAVIDFFDINEWQFHELFHADSYLVTKGAEAELAVADKIQQYIATHSAS